MDQPAPDLIALGSGPGRVLSREEIEELARAGRITPVETIPQFRFRPRVSYPDETRCTYRVPVYRQG